MADIAPPQWEYCLLSIYSNGNKAQGQLIHYDETAAVQELDDLKTIDDQDITVAISHHIARLGREGWEMVNANTILHGQHSGSEMFFKRPVR